ncbi:MAG: stage II sporulation protein M [Pseudomonadota bacterium]
MTPLLFESLYSDTWKELAELLDRAERVRKDPPNKKNKGGFAEGARLSELYRRSCEHLALARSRAYPIHLTEQLELLTHRAHRLIYRRHDYGVHRFKQLVLVDFPNAVRLHRWEVLIATLLFLVPFVAVGVASYFDRGFVLHFVDVATMQEYDGMYGGGSERLGRKRDAGDDWMMFGHYIQNNIGIAFRCFAGGLIAGLGSVFFLVYNGLFTGAIAGFVTAQGHSQNFYSFVITHAAFEITGIVLSGAAGLRLGHALVSPGRYTRVEALKQRASEAVVVMYGVIGMLVIAAFVEAFWSSSRWIVPGVKYAVGGACWFVVIAYLGWQGRPRALPADPRAAVSHAS